MTFDREKKINSLILNAAKAHQKFNDPFLKVPVELCQYALSEKKVREAQIYLSALLIFSGKASVSSSTYKALAEACNTSERTVYDKLRWLLARNWMGKDDPNGWIFFRGLNRVHQIENWKYSTAAIFQQSDLQSAKAFFIGAVLSSLVLSGNKGNGTDRESKRSGPARYPVSISTLQQVLNVSEKTAYNYRKLAQKHGFIKMKPNLKQVEGITLKDIRHLKHNHVEYVELPVFGSSETLSVSPNQLRTDKGSIYAQLPNFITPKVLMSKRNVSRSKLLTLTGIS